MSNKLLQNVIIKGTKEGLTLHLDDSCSFQMLMQELDTKLSANIRTPENSPSIKVRVHTGNRYLIDKQETELKEVILKKKIFDIEEIKSNVITLEEAKRMKEESEITSLCAIIRSGQIIEVPGDLLLIGDVNPGGEVSAGGSIFVLGTLKGIAHAGRHGKLESVVAASVLKPAMIKIGGIMNRAPEDFMQEAHEMECAFVEDGQIIIDRLQVLKQKRPHLNKFEGGF
ncbi:septum site-determining protein MinC [Peribacillus deserti]|uniref:Probable septum site-determining protein MinC n=1 Tax=Peribacillus deserti TaxID=673318 RepID=A0ABS2QGH2_9BACI|nr:septum site-determining protein MinC [Peribacillus deserti]MBM7691919.1 septum site-determining protein MinC [Peribacillus deserti]